MKHTSKLLMLSGSLLLPLLSQAALNNQPSSPTLETSTRTSMAARNFGHRQLPRQGSQSCVIGVSFREKGFYPSYSHFRDGSKIQTTELEGSNPPATLHTAWNRNGPNPAMQTQLRDEV